jgi:predicted Rdx family selenoprotein
LRQGVKAAYAKLEPRIRDAIRDRADMGHVQVQVTMDLRPAE